MVASLADTSVIDLLPFSSGPHTLSPSMSPVTTTPDEHYVLLPGDAGFQYLPSLTTLKTLPEAESRPKIVGLMATHHGAKSWFDGKKPSDSTDFIPLAPEGAQGKIVYSYGTVLEGDEAGAHYYRNDAGENGHPNKEAIDAYVNKGWGGTSDEPGITRRLNTATLDFNSKQKFNPLKLPDSTTTEEANMRGHSNGNVALGWDLGNDSPLVEDRLPPGVIGANIEDQKDPQPIMRTCKECGKSRYYYFSNPEPPKADIGTEIEV